MFNSCLYKANPSLESIRSMDLARKKTGGNQSAQRISSQLAGGGFFLHQAGERLAKSFQTLGERGGGQEHWILGFVAEKYTLLALYVRTFYCC